MSIAIWCVCVTKGFNTWQISISAVESNLAFLPLPWKIEILTIEEKQSIFFFPFPHIKVSQHITKEWPCGKSRQFFSLSQNPLVAQTYLSLKDGLIFFCFLFIKSPSGEFEH